MELVDGDFMISIHARREESDLNFAADRQIEELDFNPRSP